MLTRETLASFVSRKSYISIAHLILVIFLLMPLAGCTNDGAGGPIISSLSTPTDASAELDSDQAPDSEGTHSGGEEDPMITMTPTPAGVTAHLTWDHPPDMNVAGYNIYYGKRSLEDSRSEDSGSEESSSEESSSEGSSSEESSSEEPSSCSHGEGQTVEAPPATITGLEPNTRYFFAIRAFNESESLCSNEITAVTPPAQS